MNNILISIIITVIIILIFLYWTFLTYRYSSERIHSKIIAIVGNVPYRIENGKIITEKNNNKYLSNNCPVYDYNCIQL